MRHIVFAAVDVDECRRLHAERLPDFLAEIRKVQIADGKTADAPAALGEGEDLVRIMTMHASKGLEFDTVFLPDLNEGILPGRRSAGDQDIEEERRLFYVAMTRARKELFLSYTAGSTGSRERPSRQLLRSGPFMYFSACPMI